MTKENEIEELREKIENKKYIIDNSQVYGGSIDFEEECNELEELEKELKSKLKK